MPVEEHSNLVMVSPEEIRSISLATGLSWDEIAEPYPEAIEDPAGRIYTIGWCIRRHAGECRFFIENKCSIYSNRPWICRTYPFALEGDELRIDPCPGIGTEISWDETLDIARLLIEREDAEKKEEDAILRILKEEIIPDNTFVVIDSEGVRKISRNR